MFYFPLLFHKTCYFFVYIDSLFYFLKNHSTSHLKQFFHSIYNCMTILWIYQFINHPSMYGLFTQILVSYKENKCWRIYIYIYIYTHTYIYIYTHLFIFIFSSKKGNLVFIRYTHMLFCYVVSNSSP